MDDIIVVTTIIGNIIIALLMVWRGWAGRLQWFTLTTILAVAVDALFYWVHGFAHSIYGPSRVFLVYWAFPLLETVCIWEAYCVKVKWLEYLLLIQVGLAVIGLFTHLHGDVWTIYYIEMFTVYFNLLAMIYVIIRFSKEVNYERT
jgi:hypothetical protein